MSDFFFTRPKELSVADYLNPPGRTIHYSGIPAVRAKSQFLRQAWTIQPEDGKQLQEVMEQWSELRCVQTSCVESMAMLMSVAWKKSQISLNLRGAIHQLCGERSLSKPGGTFLVSRYSPALHLERLGLWVLRQGCH